MSYRLTERPFFLPFPLFGRTHTQTDTHYFSVSVAEVSFYGDGYIHLRTVEASVQTSLHVRFRTSSRAGLLFLAVGSRDYLLLELISGHLQVRQATAEVFMKRSSLCAEEFFERHLC